MSERKCDTMLPVKKGYILCPQCKAKSYSRLQKILPQTTATALPLYCPRCKTEYFVDVYEGRSFEHHSQ